MGIAGRQGALAPLAVLTLALVAVLSGCGVSYPNCHGDNDCHSHHEVCVNQHCQQCRQNSDCAAHQTCLRNRCIAGDNACENDGDCTNGAHCMDHRCAAQVATECDEHRACPSGQPCQAGHCAAAASDDDDEARDNHGRLCNFAPVFFQTDNSQLDDNARQALQTAADCLQREHDTRYVLIGRTDPRGTSEYNFALGERRARMAQNYLRSLGVTAERLLVSSGGSEAAVGTDESTWGHDRRVDFRPR